MLKVSRFLAVVFLSIFCVFVFTVKSVWADTLPPGLLIGDDSGIYVDDDGTYYIDLEDVMPGDQYKKTITIRALDLEDPFQLGLLVEEKSSTGPLDWNDHIELTLTLDGKEIYHGPLLGNETFDWSNTQLDLGSISYGTDKILEATFEVDSSLTVMDYLEKSEMLYYWTFVAVRQPTESSSSDSSTKEPTSSSQDTPGGKLPDTNEQQNRWALILGGFLILCLLLLLWKRKQEREEDEYD